MTNDKIVLIRQRINLVDVIEETVSLRRRGRELSGLCPFHQDTKPSLDVNAEKGVWICRSCQAGGTVFDWIMHRDGVDFKTALAILAQRAGLSDTPLPPAERRRIAEQAEARKAEAQKDRRIRDAIIRGYDILHNTRRELERLAQIVRPLSKYDMDNPIWDRIAALHQKRETVRLWLDEHDGLADEFAGLES